MEYGKHFSTLVTPQGQPIPMKNMTKNEAGGFGFKKDMWQRLDNFLILGSEGGTYYVGERELTVENGQNILNCIRQDGPRVVKRLTEISLAGRAPKNDPAIFVLALACAHGDVATKHLARQAVHQVCRIGTHLFQFMQAFKDIGGKTSRGHKRGLANFYTRKTADELAYQLIKYRQRDGWTHKDVLRLAHPGRGNDTFQKLYRFAVGKPNEKVFVDTAVNHPQIDAFKQLQAETDTRRAARIIRDHNLPWEAVPTEMLKTKEIWEALLPHTGYTALLRNLGRLQSMGFFAHQLDEETKEMCVRLVNMPTGNAKRVHPFQILLAHSTYMSGHGVKGSLSWTPNAKIVDALEAAFHLSFKLVEPTGKNLVVGIDVSGSMTSAKINNTNLSAAQAALIMATIHLRTEPHCEPIAFDERALPIQISPKATIRELLEASARFNGGGTNCAAPIEHVLKAKFQADAFVIYTDSNTWAGQQHPCQAFAEYKRRRNPHCKAIGVEMTATKTSIVDPSEEGMLSIVGMDASVPAIVNDFILGNGGQHA